MHEQGFSVQTDGSVTVRAIDENGEMVTISCFMPPNHMRQFAKQLTNAASVLESDISSSNLVVLNQDHQAGRA